MEKNYQKTLVDRLWQTIKNNRLIAALIIAGATVIAIGQFTSALDDILSFVDRWQSPKLQTEAPIPSKATDSQTSISPCVSKGGAMAIKAYAIAVSYPDSLPNFITEHAAVFAHDGDAIECFRFLASQLLSTALSGPSPSSIENKARELAYQLGRPDLTASFTDKMLHNRLDMYRLSSYLQNLADSLPSVAEGTLETYHNSAVYQNSSLIWSMTEQSALLPPSDLRAIRDMTMEMSEWYLKSFSTNVR